MKFSKIIGKIDPKLILQAEKKLSSIFIELGTNYTNTAIGTQLGGDPLIFSLIYPVEHVATANIPTAATDGKRFYWSPKFILKQSKIGLRMVCSHEAWHAIYMHPQRRGSRLPKLWNIAVDYIVNGTVMEDFASRNFNPTEMFSKNLGRFMTLDQYSGFLKDPWKQVPGFEDIRPSEIDANDPSIKLPAPNEDRELTLDEAKELERREKKIKFYYADPNLSADMRRPEKIYDHLYSLLPKCPVCGEIGKYKLPNKDGTVSEEVEEECCKDKFDIFGFGSTLDDHMDTSESEEKLAKRISDAMVAAKKMAGHVPASLESELGKLTAPKISWKDIIRTRLLKARAGNGRNDWTRFRSRPMFTGLLTPKRKNYFAHFGCLLDCSGSMSSEDIAFGLSQLISLDERSEGTIVPADAKVYFESATKIKRCNVEELSKVKPRGGGGTVYAPFFSEYEKHIGKCDFLIIISDLYLMDQDIANMVNPGIDVYWLCTSSNDDFNAPFGRVLNLKD